MLALAVSSCVGDGARLCSYLDTFMSWSLGIFSFAAVFAVIFISIRALISGDSSFSDIGKRLGVVIVMIIAVTCIGSVVRVLIFH